MATVTPYYQDDAVTLWHGDCLDVMATMPDASVHAVVTDPPYLLGFMGRQWDTRSAHEHLEWHGAWAAEAFRLLKPGGHLLAFGGTRTWHRLAVAIEDAGFEIRDSIAWLYGSGFPKSLDVSKAIDRQRTEDRAPVDAVRSWLNARRIEAGLSHDAVNKRFGHASNGGGSSSAWMTNPTSKSLPTWEQWQEIKGLFGFGDEMDAEVWRLNGRKGKPGDSWESREVVGMYEQSDPRLQSWAEMQGKERGAAKEKRGAPTTPDAARWQGWGTALKPAFEPVVVARKPLAGTVAANVLAHGTGALNVDGCRVQYASEADAAQAAVPNPVFGVKADGDGTYNYKAGEGRNGETHDVSKGRWPPNVILDDTAAAELDRQSGERKSSGLYNKGEGTTEGRGGANYQPRYYADSAAYADNGGAARFFPVFRYEAKAPTEERPRAGGVAHPTVKPLDLMRWLVRLVTPPGGTVLDPFAGSGTTAEACVIEGFRCVTIEREADYLPLILARLTKPIEPVLDLGALA